MKRQTFLLIEISILQNNGLVFVIYDKYSIVKDSSADLGVNFKYVQNWPTIKAVCTKETMVVNISKM